MIDNDKFILIMKIYTLLIKKINTINDYNVSTIFYKCYQIRLQK